jgi:NhaP-type Na+/H+ or K+/H+ antiporter
MAEMIMLFTFILFGAVLTTLVGIIPVGSALLLAAVTLFLARPAAVAIVLRRAAVSPSARWFIAWFGPRGLASLLLALLVVQAGFPAAETILAVVGVVVTVSVVLHGVSATPLAGLYANRVASATLAEERVSTAIELLRRDPRATRDTIRIEPAELQERLDGPKPPLVLDVRSRSSYARDPEGIPGDVHVPLEDVESWAAARSRDQAIVTYCT